MLTPEYLDALPDALVELWRTVEDDILRDVARRIGKAGELTDTARWQLYRLEQAGLLRRDIVKLLARYAGKSEEEMRRILQQAGTQALASDDAIYRAAGLAPGSINRDKALVNLLNAGYKQTSGLWRNLTATTAATVTGQFEAALDRAWLQVSSGAFDYKTAVKRAVDGLAKDMKYITYPTGHKDTLEVAVRRAVLTGVSQTSAKLQLARADEMGCEFVEVTAHAGARPSHAEWQGKVFHRGGAVTRDGVRYEDFERATGYGTGPGLGGWNCRHSFYPFWPGLSKPNYTPGALEALNAKDVEYNGKLYSRYEISQMQRELERKVRTAKRQYLAESEAGLDATAAAAKLKTARGRLKAFVRDTGGAMDSARVSVSGFGRSEAAKAGALARSLENTYNQRKEVVRAAIRAETTPKALNRGNQMKHIREDGRDIGNRSYLYGTLEDAQKLVDQYSGTGEMKLDGKGNWTHKEIVTAEHLIGMVVDPDTGESTPTHRFAIHYGKRGTHIVPAKEVKKK